MERPLILYHGTSARARASIAEHGLDDTQARLRAWLTKDRPLGNYLYLDEFAARAFADRNAPAGAIDVWAVDASGLALIRDPEPVGQAWYTSDPIPTERLLGIIFTNDTDICWRPDREKDSLYDPRTDSFHFFVSAPAKITPNDTSIEC